MIKSDQSKTDTHFSTICAVSIDTIINVEKMRSLGVRYLDIAVLLSLLLLFLIFLVLDIIPWLNSKAGKILLHV